MQLLLQSFVAPIYTYKMNSEGVPQAIQLQGSGFFLGVGTLITAAHVLINAQTEINAGRADGVCSSPRVLGNDGVEQNLFIKISNPECAPHPYDIAVAITDYTVVSDRHFNTINVAIADDVATLGYPESSVQINNGTIYVQARVHKGYVQRVVPQNRLVIGEENPKLYELSFAVTKGMSGSPLLTTQDNKEHVVGVCVGTHSSELLDYLSKDIEEDGTTFSEKHFRILEYGIAHDLISLYSWSPGILKGKTLADICT